MNVLHKLGMVQTAHLQVARTFLIPIKVNDKIIVLKGSIQGGGGRFGKNFYFSYMYLMQWGSSLSHPQFGFWGFSWFLTDSPLKGFWIKVEATPRVASLFFPFFFISSVSYPSKYMNAHICYFIIWPI